MRDPEVRGKIKRNVENSHQPLLGTKTEFRGQDHQTSGTRVGDHLHPVIGAEIEGHHPQNTGINIEKKSGTETMTNQNIETQRNIGIEGIDESES